VPASEGDGPPYSQGQAIDSIGSSVKCSRTASMFSTRIKSAPWVMNLGTGSKRLP
jgi:hypothetical protein